MRFTKYIICLTLVLFFTANTAGAEDEEFKVKLAFKFRVGRTYVYSITSSRSVQISSRHWSGRVLSSPSKAVAINFR